jgi:hypothetical protein
MDFKDFNFTNFRNAHYASIAGTEKGTALHANYTKYLESPLARNFHQGHLPGTPAGISGPRMALVGGLGLLAVRQGLSTVDRIRYGDYGGAMLSAAVGAAAGYGAYKSFLGRGAIQRHLTNAAAMLSKSV